MKLLSFTHVGDEAVPIQINPEFVASIVKDPYLCGPEWMEYTIIRTGDGTEYCVEGYIEEVSAYLHGNWSSEPYCTPDKHAARGWA